MQKKEAPMVRDDALATAQKLEQLFPRLVNALFSTPKDPMVTTPVGQLRILRQLESGPKSPGRIAARLGLTPGAVTQLVTRLKKVGFVSEEIDPQDRRVKLITLTDNGRSKMQQRSEMRANRAAMIFSQIDPETLKSLVITLEQLYESSEAVLADNDK